jgi:hypothetical protein
VLDRVEAKAGEREHPADPGDAHEQGDVGVVCVALAELSVHGLDLALEVVDQSQRGGDVRTPGLGDLESREQLASLDPEQVGYRAGLAEVDERRVDAALER